MQGSRVLLGRPTINIAEHESVALTEGLLNLLITEQTSGLYRCEATFGNWGNTNNAIGYLYLDRAQLDFGTALQVQFGADTLFSGRIMGLEAHFPLGESPSLTVLAEDRFQDLRMTRRTRTFVDSSDAEVMQTVIADYGLSTSIQVPTVQHALLVQLNQSDLAFLRALARALDAEVWIENSTLHIESHTSRMSSGKPLTLSYGNALRSFSVLADLSGQRTSVTVSGWSPGDKDVIQYQANESALASEVRNGQSGMTLLNSALGERKEALLHTVPISLDEAQHLAEAYLKLSARRFVVGHGVSETSGLLRVGTTVTLAGLGQMFSGDYYVAEVTHLFDGIHGMRTEFTAERPYIGG